MKIKSLIMLIGFTSILQCCEEENTDFSESTSSENFINSFCSDPINDYTDGNDGVPLTCCEKFMIAFDSIFGDPEWLP